LENNHYIVIKVDCCPLPLFVLRPLKAISSTIASKDSVAEESLERNLQTMGNANSVAVPSDEELEYVFTPEKDETTAPLGKDHGVPNTTCGPPTKVMVNEKYGSWTGRALNINHSDGSAFGNELQVQGTILSMRDRTVLLNGRTNLPVAISMRKFDLWKQMFKIYTTYPIYNGQAKSDRKYDNDQPLYTYASIERIDHCCDTAKINVTITHDTAQYEIRRSGSYWPKKRVVFKDGRVCAFMEGGTWEGKRNKYKISINPGIDQCLIVMLCGIVDQMDELDNELLGISS
jgi:hypothetical protein